MNFYPHILVLGENQLLSMVEKCENHNYFPWSVIMSTLTREMLMLTFLSNN